MFVYFFIMFAHGRLPNVKLLVCCIAQNDIKFTFQSYTYDSIEDLQIMTLLTGYGMR